jgi:uncharacterized protein YecE (DUF72 family)
MPSLQAFLDRLHAFFAAAPAGFQYAIESRNPNYLKQEFFDFLGEHGLGFVFLEGYYMPHIGEVFARCDTSAAAFTIIRLHGPDRADMEERAGGVWSQVYSPKLEGLRAAAKIVRFNTARSFQALLNVNNHYEGSAPLTPERFLSVLREQTEPS